MPENKREQMAAMYGGADLCAPGVTTTQLLAAWQQGEQKCLEVAGSVPIDDPDFCRGGLGLKWYCRRLFSFCANVAKWGAVAW